MNTKHIVPLVSVVAAISLMGLGCNPFQAAQEKMEQKVADSIAGGVLSKATGGNVNLDTEKGQMKFKDNKTGSTVSIGENMEIPEDFPKDVPVYPGAKANSIMTSTTEKTANATLTSGDDAVKITKWYEEKFKGEGWTEENSSTINDVEVREYSKDQVKITLSIWPNKDEGKTGSFITLSRSEEKASE